MAINVKDPEKVKGKRKKKATGRPVLPAASPEVRYRKQLTELSNAQTSLGLSLETDLAAGAVSNPQAIAALEAAKAEAVTTAEAQAIASEFTTAVNATHKARFTTMMSNTIGIDIVSIIDSGAVGEAIEFTTAENVKLITSVPEQQLSRIQQAILDNAKGIELEGGTLRDEIMRIGDIGRNRAELIARDQTSSLTGNLNGLRQQDAGITEYKWQTVEDRRVVGNPAGENPTGSARHMNHFRRNGKTFKWSKPPSDGHPGEPIQCRCVALPIVNVEELNFV